VSGIARWDEGAFALAHHECPALPGLLVVVAVAQRVELVEPRVVRVPEVDAVVVLRVRAGAALGGARRHQPGERHLLGGGGTAPERGDVEDIDALGDDELEDRLAKEVSRPLDWDRADAGDLAELVVLDLAAPQGLGIDAQQREEPRVGGRRGVPAVLASQVDQRIERRRIPTVAARVQRAVPVALVGEGVEGRSDDRAVLRGAACSDARGGCGRGWRWGRDRRRPSPGRPAASAR
jgi:hypothetical protein